MSVGPGQLIATANGNVTVESLVDGGFQQCFGFTWEDGGPKSVPMVPIRVSETSTLYMVETWFEGGCRDCTHQKSKGLHFTVGDDTEFLLRADQLWPVADLQNGHQLKVIGRDCGYEVVKQVQKVGLTEPVSLYTMEGAEFFALGDATLPNKVLIRS